MSRKRRQKKGRDLDKKRASAHLSWEDSKGAAVETSDEEWEQQAFAAEIEMNADEDGRW